MSDLVTHTTDSDFETDVVNSDSPVLLDFWAEWCGPCRIVEPTLGTTVEEDENRLKVIKLNIDDNPPTAPKFSVRSIPTLLLFKDGVVAAQQVGAVSKAHLTTLLDQHVRTAA